MDQFGIGAQAMGALMTVFTAARGTGRTKAMIEGLRTGDRVVFLERREAERVRRMASELGREIDVVVIPINEPHRLFDRRRAQGRLLFDHCWLEEFYRAAIRDAFKFTEAATRDLSGYDLPHVESRIAAREVQRWGWKA